MRWLRNTLRRLAHDLKPLPPLARGVDHGDSAPHWSTDVVDAGDGLVLVNGRCLMNRDTFDRITSNPCPQDSAQRIPFEPIQRNTIAAGVVVRGSATDRGWVFNSFKPLPRMSNIDINTITAFRDPYDFMPPANPPDWE